MGKVGIRDMGYAHNSHITCWKLIINGTKRTASHKLKLEYIGRDGDGTFYMVLVAQVAERKVVVLLVVGSSPI